MNLIMSNFFLIWRYLYNLKCDQSFLRRKLHSISQKIHQDLFDPQFITQNLVILNTGQVNHKLLIFLLCLFPDDHRNFFHDHIHICRFLVEFRLSALDPTDLKHLVDDCQQMIAGYPDFLQIFLDL